MKYKETNEKNEKYREEFLLLLLKIFEELLKKETAFVKTHKLTTVSPLEIEPSYFIDFITYPNEQINLYSIRAINSLSLKSVTQNDFFFSIE